MSTRQTDIQRGEVLEAAPDRRQGWFAAGGVLGAVLASACCIGPLLLVTLGVSGAWIGTLTAFEPYSAYFATGALVFIALGFRQIYWKAKPACDTGSYCARPVASVLTQSALWAATMLVLATLTTDWWAPLFF